VLEGLRKDFGATTAVRDLDLRVERGELLVLVGPSGCGKSTVLRMIAGVEEPSGGRIFIGERPVDDVEPAERDVAMVFQSYALYPHMRVRDNLAFGLRMRRTPKDEIERRVRWAAGLLGLEGLLDRRPGQLSGGQRQRVALGRALVREPSVFLFDEPLSNLDARLRAEMRDKIARLHRSLGATMIFVTHDQVEAMSLGQRVAVMRGGVIQQLGPPMEVYREPANLFVARFIGTPSINMLDGALRGDGDEAVFAAPGLTLAAPHASACTGEGAPGAAVTLGVRPEDLTLTTPDAPERHFTTRVVRIEALGSEVLVHLAPPGADAGSPGAGTAPSGADAGTPPPAGWVVRAPPGTSARPGEALGVRLEPDRTHLFDAADGRRIGTLDGLARG